MKKIIVLDRDGVINHDSDAFIKSADEWHAIDGSLQAIARLKAAGWKVAVATNQSGIKRGYYDRATLSAMHQKMHQGLQALSGEVECAMGVDWISYSPYLSEDNSPSRKPDVGMIRCIEKALNIDVAGAYFVGDTLADIQAANTAKMQPVLVKTGKGERTLATQDPLLENVPVYADLAAFVEILLETTK